MDLYTTDKPDGTKDRRVVADGNVVFMKDEERLSGAHSTWISTRARASMDDAVGYMSPGSSWRARRSSVCGEKLYHVDGGKFTSCAQPNPRWTFNASSATIEVDEKIIAHERASSRSSRCRPSTPRSSTTPSTATGAPRGS